ncbi:GspH/FimT family pseudopilin [Shewanella algae]|uniref:GspH/FimT family pseudopilin n=1 Tax=Shewanella algae TaxID=38313 RepID=UPI0011A9BB8C|nr:GspH/FimT family pseudopilin [Shewanella algae]MBO2627819.1 GspH/FimT family pseudopilin [Shewanella algae]TWO84634.1 general secretion pathway protein GspH [Shewanella algae]
MRHLQLGFSLLEVMVAMALLAVLASVGAPSLKSLYEGYRAQTGIKQVQQLLQFARNQAISYGVRVSVCALKDGRCEADAWQQGVTVFSDRNGNLALDDDDKLLFQSGAFDSQDILRYNRDAIRFLPDGLATGTNGTFKYCPGQANSPHSEALVINQAGRIRHSQDENINCQDSDGG